MGIRLALATKNRERTSDRMRSILRVPPDITETKGYVVVQSISVEDKRVQLKYTEFNGDPVVARWMLK